MSSLPEHWNDEHDHFIVYMRNSPTVFPRFAGLHHIWQDLQTTFPYLGPVDYGAFCTREGQLQDRAMQMLMDVWNSMYWWAHNHPWNPFMDSWDTYSVNIPHIAESPLAESPLGTSLDVMGVMARQTVEQTREAHDQLSWAAQAGRVAVGAAIPESHTASSMPSKATAITNSQPGHHGDIGFTEPSSEDDGDRTLRHLLKEDLGTMKGRRRLGLLKRGENSQKVT